MFSKFTYFKQCLVAILLWPGWAFGGTFDEYGNYEADPNAVTTVHFEDDTERYLPDDVGSDCTDEMYTKVTSEDAIDGEGYVHIDVNDNCAERFLISLPLEQGSYRASVWMRHGSLSARITVKYPDDSDLYLERAELFPTGRTTSDGWVELASNSISIDASLAEAVYLRVIDFADEEGVDMDALELVQDGTYRAQQACSGISDSSCGTDSHCEYNLCVRGEELVPPLPSDELKEDIVNFLSAQLKLFFGGHYSRSNYLPNALSRIEQARNASTAWEFWNGWTTAIRELHDWHTSANYSYWASPSHRLNACFIEGNADKSNTLWPHDPKYPDILVSHSGDDAMGLKAGDRLIAVDGMHPIAWARALIEHNAYYHVATDPDVFADFVENLGGPYWLGGGLIIRYATNISVIRCDGSSGECASTPETILIEDLPTEQGTDVACDNRPFYHLESDNPSSSTHYVFYDFFRDRIANTTEEEAIYGMIWDTLYGGGDDSGWVNSNILSANEDFKANARGVILDHRAGNGGTLDAATNVTKLVRPRETLAVVRMPMGVAGYDGPSSAEEGIELFDEYESVAPYEVGDVNYDPDLPVALILHRDGSASDYMPLGMKGAPKVRIFGPNTTAGAFSTYIQFSYWGTISYQFASGETITADGTPLIGYGVEPDEIILPLQSDLVAGKDTLFEAALAWVRTELKP